MSAYINSLSFFIVSVDNGQKWKPNSTCQSIGTQKSIAIYWIEIMIRFECLALATVAIVMIYCNFRDFRDKEKWAKIHVRVTTLKALLMIKCDSMYTYTKRSIKISGRLNVGIVLCLHGLKYDCFQQSTRLCCWNHIDFVNRQLSPSSNDNFSRCQFQFYFDSKQSLQI